MKGSLGDKVGWTAMFYQWIHITVGMDMMMYVIIGALSITFGTPWFNTTPIVRFILMMIILFKLSVLEKSVELRNGYSFWELHLP